MTDNIKILLDEVAEKRLAEEVEQYLKDEAENPEARSNDD